MKIKHLCLMAIVFVLCLVGCSESDQPGNKLNPSISLDQTSIELKVDEMKVVNASTKDLTGDIIWSSSDELVATVESGVITGVKAGSCTITATVGDFTATVTVKVNEKEKVKYTVKFLDSDYSVLKTETVEEGESATAPEVPSSNEKVFSKWDKDYTNVKSDLNIIAIYSNKYQISYDLNGGILDGESKEFYFDGDGFDLPTAHKAGCDFLGWIVNGNEDDVIVSVESGKKGNLVLKAEFNSVNKIKTIMDFQKGISNEVYLANKSSAYGSLAINAYNNTPKAYWSNGYTDYIYIAQKNYDPAATFSDRFYIKKDTETGLYQIISVLLSGASSWPTGAEYVITYSSSYKNHTTVHNGVGVKASVGDYVVFEGDFTTIKSGTSINCYFFNGDPSNFIVSKTYNKTTDQLITPTRLGFKFLGWVDSYGNKITKVSDLYVNCKIIAQWEERTPVTAIDTNEVKTEMITGDTFQITAKVVPNDAYFQSIFYETSNKDIVSVDSTGKLFAKSTGKATITIYDFMKKVTLTKDIDVYAIDSIDLNLGNFDGVLSVGETLQLNPVNVGKNTTGITYTYTSKDTNILEVSATGLITAKGNGSTIITIKDSCSNTHTLEIGVTVNDLPATERVDKLLKLIAENNIATIQAGNVCLYNDGTERYYNPVYSSVNYFLFQEYKVNKTYHNNTVNPEGSPQARRTDSDHDDSIQFVTVHDTATLTGQAANTASGYRYNGKTGGATIHYTTGQNTIYSAVDESFIAWHAGDGTSTKMEWYETNIKAPTTGELAPNYTLIQTATGYNYAMNGEDTGIAVPSTGGKEITLSHLGPIWKVVDGYYYIGKTWFSNDYKVVASKGGNNNSIGIEMGVNYKDDIYNTWQITAQLCADICLRNNLPTYQVKQHNTWSGKNCPQCLISTNYWFNFMKMVEINYEVMKNYSDATIEMTPNSSLISASGRITTGPETTTTVSYTVKVTIGDVSKTITLYNVVPGTTTWEQWQGSYPASQVWNDGYFSKNDIIDKPYLKKTIG